MRRHITIAIVLMVLATLVLSGLVSLVIAQNANDAQTRSELAREARGLATIVENKTTGRAQPARALRALLASLDSPLRLDGSAVLGLRPSIGSLYDPLAPRQPPILPGTLTLSDLRPASLALGETVSGQTDTLIFAAFPFPATIEIAAKPRSVILVIVLTRRPPGGLGSAARWLAISALAILAVAALVANRLARRFTASISRVREVTSRIAGGDLEARVPPTLNPVPEMEGLAESINTMAANLDQAKRSDRQFLRLVSHDLRTPLTSIRGFAEAIEDGATPNSVEAASVIATEARRLERLVSDLLALATIDARQFSLQMQSVDLALSSKSSVEGFLPSAAQANVSLECAAPPGPVWANADPDRLAQVTANLIENALRYAASRVEVSTGFYGDSPQLTVTDDGPGISSADLPHVFEPLFVSRTAATKPSEGSGLGLAIVSQLVRAMGGSVRAESPSNSAGGTRIIVTLTKAQAAAPFES